MYTVILPNLFCVFNLQKKRERYFEASTSDIKDCCINIFFPSSSYVFPLGCFIVMEVILIEQ